MVKISYPDFATRLRNIMSEKHMKHTDVAQYLGIKKSSFHAYIDGTRLPPTEALYKISILFNVSMEYLLTGESIESSFLSNDSSEFVHYNQPAPNNETLLDRIRKIAQEKNITISDIEHNLGFGHKSMYRWDQSSPSVDKVNKVADFLNVSLRWLVTGSSEYLNLNKEENEFLKIFNSLSKEERIKIMAYIEISQTKISPNTSTELSFVKDRKNNYCNASKTNAIPVLGYVAAGMPIEGITLPMGYLQTDLKADYALVAKGESMEPVIKDKEYIFVRKTSVLDNGDIGIFYINGEVTCKEFHKTDSQLILKSLNLSFKPFNFSLNSLENSMIQGKVILSDEQKARLENF